MKSRIGWIMLLALTGACSQSPKSSDVKAADTSTYTPENTTSKPVNTNTPVNKSDHATDATRDRAPDNTGVNLRDKDGKTLTPTDQAENQTDITLTKQVRQSLMDDDALSMDAKNVKIISRNGTVTLRGPVKTQAEKDSIEAKAKSIAGVQNVDNQLEVQDH